ncbi:cellulose-binding domain-containing protein [Thaumasiovibrio subtropicus]|uniref:cellulose-binding domain-containing protein n=1 Tax=Thaumasiovibrio subtropicus TaxID=1891207 RepID=UPI000B35DFDE|nr:cellulose-binding domain-containing protein [Thaumasiovibrio subtropicus]
MKKQISAALLSALALTGAAEAGSLYHRVVWDANPSSQATIGFTPNGGTGHYVMWGHTTDETQWQQAAVTSSETFGGSLTSEFVRLTGLWANNAVYYRVCDSTGCGDRYWFQTASNGSEPFVAVAGGDTRTGWTTRRKGNALIAKIRPLFVMHGGDFTNANSVSEMKEYLSDWQLTFSDDVINGINYQRIYPFIPTHGNHEDGNYKTLCQVFGVDYNQNGQCDYNDTYGAFNISPLMRVYTLNSQFKNSGWSSYASAMNTWLAQDMAAKGPQVVWRVAQYHKPMFPHYTGKSENTVLFGWWASTFFNNDMNLVVESDTHINKMTYPIKPSGSTFSATTTGGTVYVGEGSWGAPARSANDPKSWTIDLASIQQFKVLNVSAETLEVRTAQFDSGAATLSREARLADSLALPAGVNWWQAAGIGEVLTIKRAANGLSVIDDGTPVEPPVETPITLGETISNLSGGANEEVHYMLTLDQAVSSLTVAMSGGTGDADLYVRLGSKPTTAYYSCRPYKNGNNETCDLGSVAAGKVYIMARGYTSFSGVSLFTSAQATGGGSGDTGGGNSGSCNTTDIPVYPNWPQTDWSGAPSHATGGDQMVYEGKVYQANYWTQSVPGSDGSWTLVCPQS